MKCIALKDFRKTRGMRNFAIKSDDLDHPDHIHKGFQFDIGGDGEFSTLAVEDQKMIGELAQAGCIGPASDEKLVAKITAELGLAEKKAAKEAADAKAADNSSVAELLVKLLGSSKLVSAAAPAVK